MTLRLAILDIGATLVTGPSRGPASRIAEAVGLDRAQKAALAHALMTTPFGEPGEVAGFVHRLTDGVIDAPDAVTAVWTAQRSEAQPIAGALAALERLHARGIRLALISNIWEPYLRAVRVHYGGFFDAHVAPELQLFSCREGCAKPASELFERSLQRAGVAPAEAVMIGDSYAEDIAPAAALGMRTTWVLHRPQREAANVIRVLNGAAAAPTRTIAAIAELASAVDADASAWDADASTEHDPPPASRGVPVARAVR